MKNLPLLFLALFLVACGTQTQVQTKYVCFNGATVDQVNDCLTPQSQASVNTLTNTTSCAATPDEKQFAVTADYLFEELKKDLRYSY